MDIVQLLIAGGVMAGLGLILATVLAVANRKLHVEEDPRIDVVEEMLPGANCGACGNAGCRAFAEAIVNGAAAPSGCPVASEDAVATIAEYLGIEAGSAEKRVARCACGGGHNVAVQKAHYRGIPSCRAATLIAGGQKGCAWGCLGLADCERACPFDAIVMGETGLPVVSEEKCTACGKCVEACPKDLFSLHPLTHQLFVNCNSEAFGKDARSVCDVACIGCGLCAKDAADGLISMKNNLPRVDYDKNELADIKAIQRCPTGAIVWLDPQKGVVRGDKAKEVQGKDPLPVG